MSAAPELTCCTPRRVPFPSGLTWAHADYCKVHPKQKVRTGDDHPSRWRGARKGWWSPQPFAGLAAEANIWRAHNYGGHG